MDGGEYGYDLPELLEERRVKRLRAAICSSACSERLGGILELLEADYAISEYWLPDNVERIIESACRFNRDWRAWVQHLSDGDYGPVNPPCTLWKGSRAFVDSDSRQLEGAAVLAGLATMAILMNTSCSVQEQNYFNDGHLESTALTQYFSHLVEILAERASMRRYDAEGVSSHSTRLLGYRLFCGGGPEELARLCGQLLLAEAALLPGGGERGLRATVQGLALAVMAAALISCHSPRIRSFRHTGQREDYLVPRHPVLCLNGIEVDPLDGIPEDVSPLYLSLLARQISGRRGGLVFQYGDIGCSALFCGDSRMMFLNKGESVALDRPTVVAAPRQGTVSAERAYAHIGSKVPDSDVWVRSYFSNARKISASFKEQGNKVCLNNCHDLTLQEILLSFETGRWRISAGGVCFCG